MADDRDLKKGGVRSAIKLHLKGGTELPHDLDDLIYYFHYLGVIPDPSAIELLERGLFYQDFLPNPFAEETSRKLKSNLRPRTLQTISPEYLGLDDVTIGEFYGKVRAKNFQLCSLMDACRFAIEDGQELGKERIYLGMIPIMCPSDKIKRTLLLQDDENGVLRMEGVSCLEQIWLGDKFLFRVR